MKIARNLNLVVPIDTEKGTIYIHSTPISREVWETYFLVLSKTYAAIFSEGLSVISGPTVAGMLLRKIAVANGEWEGDAGVKSGLINEIHRISNVALPGPRGWETIPLEDAVAKGVIDDDTLAEAENAIIFFIVVSAVLRGPQSRAKLLIALAGMATLWGTQTTSSNSTEYANSLPTSTPDVNTGEKIPASSVPS